jgi:Polysaccharide lyase
VVNLGYIPAGTWHTFMVKAVWSHDPSKGRIEFYLDGALKLKVTGRDANLGPTSNRIPSFKLGMYGDYAVGRIDVDNVRAGPTSTTSSTVAFSSPTNVRVVSGE